MKVRYWTVLLYAASIVIATRAQTESAPPGWEIHDLCDGARKEECLNIENTARVSVLARWPTVPENDREACMSEIDRAGVRSYRRLLDCFDDRAMKALESEPGKP